MEWFIAYLVAGIVVYILAVIDAAEGDWEFVKSYYRNNPGVIRDSVMAILLWPMTLVGFIHYKIDEYKESKEE